MGIKMAIVFFPVILFFQVSSFSSDILTDDEENILRTENPGFIKSYLLLRFKGEEITIYDERVIHSLIKCLEKNNKKASSCFFLYVMTREDKTKLRQEPINNRILLVLSDSELEKKDEFSSAFIHDLYPYFGKDIKEFSRKVVLMNIPWIGDFFRFLSNHRITKILSREHHRSFPGEIIDGERLFIKHDNKTYEMRVKDQRIQVKTELNRRIKYETIIYSIKCISSSKIEPKEDVKISSRSYQKLLIRHKDFEFEWQIFSNSRGSFRFPKSECTDEILFAIRKKESDIDRGQLVFCKSLDDLYMKIKIEDKISELSRKLKKQ